MREKHSRGAPQPSAQQKRVLFRVLPCKVTGAIKGAGWTVQRSRGGRRTTLFARADGRTKADAVAWAVAEAQRCALAQVVIHKRDGRLQAERTYPRASDPRRTKG